MWWLIIGVVLLYVMCFLIASHLDDKERIENNERLFNIYADEAKEELKKKDDLLEKTVKEKLAAEASYKSEHDLVLNLQDSCRYYVMDVEDLCDQKQQVFNEKMMLESSVKNCMQSLEQKDKEIQQLRMQKWHAEHELKNVKERNDVLVAADYRNTGLYYKIVDLSGENERLKSEIKALKK